MLKNTTNSRKVGRNLQRKVLKDAANSGKEDYNLQRKVLKDAANSGKEDHDLQKKSERRWQFKRSQSRSSSFDYDAEK